MSTAISVAGLGKVFRTYARPIDRILQAIYRPRKIRYREFRALDGVSFQVRSGEVLGILGRNGSGKSTLLQILAGTLPPTSGAFEVQGRVAALLELGTGFNPDFDGIDNARLNAGILGLSAEEVEAKLPEIVAFADIGDFVYQPVKTYSSGMYVRLAFAVAACVDPDLLIVDEALAVGDVQFQSKCFRRFEELVARGKTIILVTHSTEQVVRHCSRALLLEKGRLIADGEPRAVANQYLAMMLGAPRRRGGGGSLTHAQDGADTDARVSERLENRIGYCGAEHRWGEGGARIVDIMLAYADEPDAHMVQFDSGDLALIVARVAFDRACENPVVGFFIKTPDGVTVYGNSTRNLIGGDWIGLAEGQEVVVRFKCELNLGPGAYLLSLGISEDRMGEIIPLDRRYDVLQFEVFSYSGSVGLADLRTVCELDFS